jgi:hypothetical protein
VTSAADLIGGMWKARVSELPIAHGTRGRMRKARGARAQRRRGAKVASFSNLIVSKSQSAEVYLSRPTVEDRFPSRREAERQNFSPAFKLKASALAYFPASSRNTCVLRYAWREGITLETYYYRITCAILPTISLQFYPHSCAAVSRSLTNSP